MHVENTVLSKHQFFVERISLERAPHPNFNENVQYQMHLVRWWGIMTC